MNSQNQPNLTAYVLGELDGAQAHEVREHLLQNGAAAHDLEQIEAVTDALRHTAPIPTARLTPAQRHAVLHPAHLPRMVQPMKPRPAPVPRSQMRPVFWTVMGGMMKAAAVLALTSVAFFLGRQMPEKSPTVVQKTPPPAIEPKNSVVAQKAPQSSPAPQVAVAPKPAVTVQKPALAPQAPVAEKVQIAASKPAPAVKAIAAPQLGFSPPAGALGAFASTTKQAAGQFSLRPAMIKAPALPRDPTALAAPLPAKATKAPAITKSPELLIHSWKSEVAACPWNEGNRLLRIVIQLPASQSAVIEAEKNASYPVNISFDPLHVKQFRLLGERHLPAADAGSAGTQIIWYEFQPNGGAVIKSEVGRQIASVSVFGARFTTQAVGPFDSTRLQVLDRGYSLENARDDFVFESAVIGLGMLMRGSEQTGMLNHEMVLGLARRAKNTAASVERDRFIQLVEDARRVTGL